MWHIGFWMMSVEAKKNFPIAVSSEMMRKLSEKPGY